MNVASNLIAEDSRRMSDAPKKLVIGSMIAAALVALLAICDLVLAVPFSGGTDDGQGITFWMDILFIVAAAIIGYLAYDAYNDLR